jgi:IPT/TIG domain
MPIVLVAAFAAILPVPASATEQRTTARVPADIAGNCSADVTQALTTWIASRPDRSVIAFARGACYRIDGTLELSGRNGLSFDGNGSSFRASRPPTAERAMWRIIDSRDIAIHNLTIDGSYGRGGTIDVDVQHAHAIDVRGSSVHIRRVTMTDVAGDCVYFGRGSVGPVARSSGDVRDSTCLRTGRNAIAVVAGDDILVQHLKTDKIGYDVFDVEPNPGRGYGSNNVRFDQNTIGSYALNVYSIVESGPIRNQSFTDNRVVGHGLKIAVADPTRGGFRPANVTIAGNRSDTKQRPSAINVDNVDGLVLRGNAVPMTGGPMAAIRGSCGLVISGNSYPGGSTEALVKPTVCSFRPVTARPGASVIVKGSGFGGATQVTLNARPACFTVHSSARITVVVPENAKSGAITVKTPSGTATSRTRLTVKPVPVAAGACTP